MRVGVLCPDHNLPSGGIRILYRQVDILNRQGVKACIIHSKEGFRCSWFENSTKIASIQRILMARGRPEFDYVVIPEIYGQSVIPYLKGYKKVLFNQGWCYTFKDYRLGAPLEETLYGDPDTVAVMASSDYIAEYLTFAFPKLKVCRVHCSLNPEIFGHRSEKKKQICFMPRRNAEDVKQVINILGLRGALDDFKIVQIEDRSEREVAEILKESLIFLSFGHPEGFSLPPAEAMASGCIVIGYHGFGAKEFMKPDLSFPIEAGDIPAYVRAVERVIADWNKDPGRLSWMAKQASEYVLNKYSPSREESDLAKFWSGLTSHSQSRPSNVGLKFSVHTASAAETHVRP